MKYKLAKLLSHVSCWLPLAWLIYGAFSAQLGGDPQEKVLHELGLWALILLLLSLTMTPARLLIPQIPWIKFRRMLGLYAFFYALLHLTIYTIFYLQADFGELWREIKERPYITVGMLAVVGLIPLAITSTRGFQRRMGRRWKKLHQIVYPIAGLALVHFLWQSKSDLNEPFIYVLWASILLIVRFKMNKDRKVSSSAKPMAE